MTVTRMKSRQPYSETEVTAGGISFTVLYVVSGGSLRETEIDQSEMPEVAIESVMLFGEDLIDVLSEVILEKIQEQVEEMVKS